MANIFSDLVGKLFKQNENKPKSEQILTSIGKVRNAGVEKKYKEAIKFSLDALNLIGETHLQVKRKDFQTVREFAQEFSDKFTIESSNGNELSNEFDAFVETYELIMYSPIFATQDHSEISHSSLVIIHNTLANAFNPKAFVKIREKRIVKKGSKVSEIRRKRKQNLDNQVKQDEIEANKQQKDQKRTSKRRRKRRAENKNN